MSTGLVDNWLNLDQFGAIYPFVGTEGLLTVAGLIFWFGWHVWQHQKESAEFENDLENIKKQGGVGKVLEAESNREMKDTVG